MGSKGSSTTKQSFSLPPEFQQAYKKSIDMATAATNQPYQAYQGQLVAGLNPTQLQGISNVNAAQGMALPAIGRGIALTERAAQGITPELYNQFYSPYVRDVADTTFANMMESNAQQRSGLKSGAIQAGAFGGDRGGIAQAEMARQQNLGLGQTMSGIYNQGYGQAMQLAGQQAQNYGAMGQQLAGLGVGAQGSVLQGAQAQLAAGAQQQATDQAQLQAAYEQWMQRQAYPYQQAQFFANIAQGLGAGAGGTSSTTTPGPSWGSQALGAVGALGSIFSDEKMKENIEAVGTLNDGQTIYRYNYKGDPKTQIGLMAQEVETRNPGAVGEVNGLKMVNYKDATDNAASMGGLVTPDMQRAAFAAGGGIPYYPYETVGFVPEGKIGRGGRGIPEAPPAFKDEGLADDWKAMKPLTEEQVGGLKALADKLGLSFDKTERKALGDILRQSPDDVNAPKFESAYPTYSGFASGGVAGRNGYLFGGEPTMEDAMNEAGLAGVGYEEPSRLLRRESGGNFSAKNDQGYVGRAQFGEERLADARKAGVIPADMDPESFRLNPKAQMAAEEWHFGDINDFIDKNGLAAYEGKEINGIPVTREGMVNVAHLGGKGGLAKFLASGGQYNPADANGTNLSDYLAMAAEGSGVAGANIQPMADEAPAEEAPRSRFSIDKLIASEDNPSIIESIMGRRLSPEARAAVMNASFAMLAGRSPFMGVNIGEAGKVGMQTYYNALQQKRELAKQQADIGRQGFEAETGRMQVDVQERNAQRQLAALILPIIRNYMAMGQPVPPQYMQLLNQALPPGSPERQQFEASAQSVAPGAPAVSGGGEETPAAVPGVEPIPEPGMPAPEGTETVTPPEEGDGQPSVDDNALAEIYSKVPQEQNPYYWDQRAQIAETAANADLAATYREKAAEIRKADFDRGYIAVPGEGRVPYPGKLEQQQAEELNKLQTAGAYEATTEQTKVAQNTIRSFQTAQNTLESAAQKLATAETGQFADAKTYLVTALQSIGVPQDAELLNQARNIQELRKVFSQILFSGGLKDKIGSQIAASELEMFSRGFGDVNLEPGANRYIVGTMRGLLAMESQRAKDWLAFMDEKGGKPLSRREIASWEQKWNEENSVSDFVKQGIGSTPVKGEVDWKRWGSDPEYQSQIEFTPGYQYVMPTGEIKVYTGNPEDRYFVPVDQYGG